MSVTVHYLVTSAGRAAAAGLWKGSDATRGLSLTLFHLSPHSRIPWSAPFPRGLTGIEAAVALHFDLVCRPQAISLCESHGMPPAKTRACPRSGSNP